MVTPIFPGRILKKGEPDRALVKLVQAALQARGYGPLRVAEYDSRMVATIMQFQSQNVDITGHPLAIDGKVGPFTWGALFGEALQTVTTTTPLLERVLEVAAAEIGVVESPPGSNRGPEVDAYLASAGISASTGTAAQRAWCAAFVYWCFVQAAKTSNVQNPAVRTAGVLEHWRRAKSQSPTPAFTKEEAISNPLRIVPGAVFIHNYGGGLGHMGFVVRAESDGRLTTIEGNVAAQGEPGRDGICVAQVSRRKITDGKLIGFITYQ